MSSQDTPGTIRRLIRHMRQPREMAWAFGSSFWLALVVYFAMDAKEHGIITHGTSALLATVLGFGGFLLLMSIKAWRDVQREERAAGLQRLHGSQAEE